MRRAISLACTSRRLGCHAAGDGGAAPAGSLHRSRSSLQLWEQGVLVTSLDRLVPTLRAAAVDPRRLVRGALWVPDQSCRRLRRRLGRREQLVHARTRAKNEIHAVLMRRLQGKPPCSDLFGVKGREWLTSLDLPVEETETIQAGLRHIAFLDAEIEEVER